MEKTKPNKEERIRRSTILVCIRASIAFWFSIKLSATYSKVESISILYSLPQGLAFVQEPPSTLEATVRATGWELLAQSFRKNDRVILVDSIDLRTTPDGIISIKRAVAQAFNETGLEVEAMTNERILLRTEAVDLKRVPVELIKDISFAKGYSSGDHPMLSPDSFTITGPKSVLDSIFSWKTDTIKLSELSDTLTTLAIPKISDNNAVRVEPQRISVFINTEQFTEKRLYIPIKVIGVSAQDSVTLFPSQVLVSFAVGLSDYEEIHENDFSLVVDLSELNEDKVLQVPVLVQRSPEPIGKVSVQPRTVEAFIRPRSN